MRVRCINAPQAFEENKMLDIRNHRVRTAAGIAVAAIAVVTPAALYATGMFSGDAPPAAAEVSDTSAPSDGRAPTDAATGSAAGTTGAPDGRIADPANATLPLPAWKTYVPGNLPCPSGPVKFAKGNYVDGEMPRVQVLKSVYADLDADGAQETLVLLRCGVNEVGFRMVAAFDKDAAGKIVPLGNVVQSTTDGGGGLEVIDDLRAAGGAVEVHVGDQATCCDTPPELTQWQWRAYSWQGTAFAQTGGPHTFPANPHVTELHITTAAEVPLTKDPADPQRLFGSITFTAHNAGPQPTRAEGRIRILLPDRVDLLLPQAGCQIEGRMAYCPLTLAVGESRTITLAFSAAANAPIPLGYPGTNTGNVGLAVEMAPKLVGEQAYGVGQNSYLQVTLKETR
jgi:hypothetical protein